MFLENMNWIELASAVGIGTLLAKLFDVFVLQRKLERRAKSEWLRTKRYDAFSDLAQNILSFGLDDPRKAKSPFESYAIASRAMLLIQDDKLCEQIDHFIVKRQRMEYLSDSGKSDEANAMYNEVYPESRGLIAELRKELARDET